MLDSKEFNGLASSVSNDEVGDRVTVSMEACEADIRTRLSQAIDEEIKKNPKVTIRSVFKEITKQVIDEYIKTVKPAVKGYVSADGKLELQRLNTTLLNNFIGYGPLQEAMDSGTITEIQINEFDNIWVEEKGQLRRYTRTVKQGTQDIEVPVTFGTYAKYKAWVDRLLMEDNKKLTEENAVIDAISSGGIRINVVGENATVEYKVGKTKRPTINVTLRKQPEQKWTTKQLIENGTMSTGIAKMMEIIPNTKASTFVIGATGSGKTVLINVLCDNIPNEMRVFAVGNPPELRLKRRDPATGVMLNNVIHTKATPWVGAASSIPRGFPDTLNLIGAAMRVTPEIAIMEELRFFKEFERFTSLATSGHCVVTSFHSDSAVSAINRMITELQSANPALTRESICDIVASFLNFIVVQEKQPDGTRKVIEFAEVCGTTVDATGKANLKINYIYKFIRQKEKIAPGTKITKEFLKRKVKGAHYRVGVISPKMRERMIRAGFTEEMFEFVTKPLPRNDKGQIIPEKDVYVYDPIFKEGEV